MVSAARHGRGQLQGAALQSRDRGLARWLPGLRPLLLGVRLLPRPGQVTWSHVSRVTHVTRAAGGARASSGTARARVTGRRCRSRCSRWSTSRPWPADPPPGTASCSADSRGDTFIVMLEGETWIYCHYCLYYCVCVLLTPAAACPGSRWGSWWVWCPGCTRRSSPRWRGCPCDTGHVTRDT